MFIKNFMAVFLEFIFLTCFFIFITGFIPFAPAELYSLFDQKPALHRGLVAAASALGAFIFYWRKNALFIFSKFKSFSISHKVFSWVLFVTAGSIWTYASWMRHQSFKSGFDMAIFTQAIWNTVHGKFLYSSIKGGICLLGDHFSPVLAFFALPFALWPKPECLLLLQAFAAASAVFPLYRLVQKKTGDSFWSLCIIAAFCLYLPLRNSVRFEFHPEITAIPLLLWAYVFLSENKSRAASLMLILALSTKESLAPVTWMFGVYALIFSKHKIFAAFWIIFSPVYLYLVTQVWIPTISGQDYFYLSGNFMAWKEKGMGALLNHLFNKESLAYLMKIYLPTGGLSFFDPSFLLNLPALLQNLSSRNEATRSIFFQYTITLTPFVFISAAEVLMRFYPKRFIILYLLFSSVLMAGVSDFYIAARFQAQKIGDSKVLSGVFAEIPESASVRTHEFLASHLANRQELHIFENNHPREGGSEKAQNTDYVILHRELLRENASSALSLLEGKYNLLLEKEGVMVFRKL